MLPEFIIVNKLKAKLHVFEDEVVSSSQASRLANVPLNQIVKSLVFLDDTKEPLLVIVRGIDRCDMDKIKALTGTKTLKLATSKQVFEITGYDVGGVPPISIFGIKTICDEKVLKEKKVFSGGGDIHTLLEIAPGEIQEMVDDFVAADITVQ